ncbi:MAG: polyhydroxyalkanoate synthesis regulator DNA-binding domain-containing protein [Thermodesulfobacteriota bacterium]|nr:polyhydroxyalkanoate synthesis regulator DNA-binding domain-containing protein [Thermodesulfobacteriota bacterium]
MVNKRIVKKYPNRRLYDTEKSIYITLNDLSEIIRQGNRVDVHDVKTGEDVTAFTLTQIVMNKAKENKALLPVSLLHMVIQSGENLLHEFFEKYLEKTIENYLAYRKNLDDQLNAYMELGMDFSSITEKALKVLTPFNLSTDSSLRNKENNSSNKKD